MESAISVIRVSGEECFELLDKIFDRNIKIEGHKAYFGNIIDISYDDIDIATYSLETNITLNWFIHHRRNLNEMCWYSNPWNKNPNY